MLVLPASAAAAAVRDGRDVRRAEEGHRLWLRAVPGSTLDLTIADKGREVAEVPNEEETIGLSADEQLRRRAVKRLRARTGFWTHLLVYLTFNTFIVVIWAVTSGGFFWPVFPIVLWGIGLIANAWDVFGPDLVSEDRIQREVERLRH